MSDADSVTPLSAPSASRILIFVNPEAGAGRGTSRLQRLLRSAPVPERASIEIAAARSVEEICEALARSGPDTLPVAAGGDGTLNMLAMALDLTGRGDATIALLPLGTWNILARELGMRSIGDAMRALWSGVVRPVDLMRTSHPSMPIALTSLSGGFEGTFVARYNRFRRFGRPVGALAGLATSRGACAPVTLELDGDVVAGPDDGVFSAGVYNSRCYPLDVVMSPDADLSDGRGEGVVYRTAGAFWATVGAGVRGGSRGGRLHVVRRRWVVARIESDGPLQIDGESVEGGSVSVRIEAGALRILVPGVT